MVMKINKVKVGDLLFCKLRGAYVSVIRIKDDFFYVNYKGKEYPQRYDEIDKIVIKALGGKSNIKNVDNCITRLRIDLGEVNIVDQKLLETSGCTGIFLPASKHIHIVYGPLVEFVRNAVDDELSNM